MKCLCIVKAMVSQSFSRNYNVPLKVYQDVEIQEMTLAIQFDILPHTQPDQHIS